MSCLGRISCSFSLLNTACAFSTYATTTASNAGHREMAVQIMLLNGFHRLFKSHTTTDDYEINYKERLHCNASFLLYLTHLCVCNIAEEQARGGVSTCVDNLALTSDPDAETPISSIVDKAWAEGSSAGFADHDILAGVLAAIELEAIVGCSKQRSSRPATSG